MLVKGHCVLNQPLCPVFLYIELILQAAKQLAVIENISCAQFARVDDLETTSSLNMNQNKSVQFVLKPSDQTSRKCSFAFLAQKRHINTNFEKHVVGRVEIIPVNDTIVIVELERIKKLLQHLQQNQSQNRNQKIADMIAQPDGEVVHDSLVYKIFFTVVQYRDFYQGVRRSVNSNGDMVVAEVYLSETQPGCIQELFSMPVAIDNFFRFLGSMQIA